MSKNLPIKLLNPEGSIQIDFPDFGCLDFRCGSPEIAFLSLFGDDRLYRPHPAASIWTQHVMSPDESSVLLATSEALYFFDARKPSMSRPMHLERFGEGGFDHMELICCKDYLLASWELGAAAISFDGAEIWRKSRQMLFWRIQGEYDGLLVYGDPNGDIHTIDARTGELSAA